MAANVKESPDVLIVAGDDNALSSKIAEIIVAVAMKLFGSPRT
jgi:hypothetical protein